MTKTKIVMILLAFNVSNILMAQTGVKILFDGRKAESAGNADWVIDADQWNLLWNPNATLTSSVNEANPQRIPTPSQSLVTYSTTETYWTGSLSNWALDCVKKGYQVETLPYNVSLTYGNTLNPQDLSNYKVFIVDEPNILFTLSEKVAMMHFVQNGGGLFLISDHTISDRNGDGQDSPVIWNDFIANNSVLNNGLGFSFDLANISQTSNNVVSSPTDTIIHGTAGNVTQVQWSNGTTMSLTPSQNPSVKAVIYTTGTTPGNINVLCAYARVGNGKVAAIGDSSPPDDGTGDPNDVLYNGYTADAGGNHQKLLMNITIWLASGGSIATSLKENDETVFNIYPNPVANNLSIELNNSEESYTFQISDILGNMLVTDKIVSASTIDLSSLASGIYFIKIISKDNKMSIKKFLKVN